MSENDNFLNKIEDKLIEKYNALLNFIEKKISLRIFLFAINVGAFLTFLISLIAQSPVTTIIGIIIFFISLIKLI